MFDANTSCSTRSVPVLRAARLEARFDVAQALTAPEAEKHTRRFSTNQERLAVREVHDVAPLDGFLELANTLHLVTQMFDKLAPPAVT